VELAPPKVLAFDFHWRELVAVAEASVSELASVLICTE
jgi:hypothetical protein